MKRIGANIFTCTDFGYIGNNTYPFLPDFYWISTKAVDVSACAVVKRHGLARLAWDFWTVTIANYIALDHIFSVDAGTVNHTVDLARHAGLGKEENVILVKFLHYVITYCFYITSISAVTVFSIAWLWVIKDWVCIVLIAKVRGTGLFQPCYCCIFF